MRALIATGDPATTAVQEVDESRLSGDVAIDVTWSSINFKDALAIAGRPGVIREWPKIPGIDLVGTLAAAVGDYAAGDRVIVNGWGLGESRDGGLATHARVDAHMLTRIPAAFTDQQAAALGTAGYTAALGVLALLDASVPLSDADVLVTGSGGGVGSIAISLFAALGARVTAVTGRGELSDWLRSLGANDVIDRNALTEPGKPLQTAKWDVVADAVGGRILANALAQVQPGGHATACGLAAGADLPATVLPFILRGITLHGIHSVEQPATRRDAAYALLAEHLNTDALDAATTVARLDEAPAIAARVLAGDIRGRVVIDVHR